MAQFTASIERSAGARRNHHPHGPAPPRRAAASPGGAGVIRRSAQQAGATARPSETQAGSPDGRLPGSPEDRSGEMPDEALMAGIARGEATAFRGFVARHTGRSLGLARRMLGPDPPAGITAEDIVQEAFTRLWVHAPRWVPPDRHAGARPGARPSSWLYRVIVNLCTDQRRRRRAAPLADFPEPASPAPDAQAGLEASETQREIAAALDRLPENQRTALTLCFFEELSNAEAATIMGLSVRAVESLLVRARRRLRKSLRTLYEQTKE